jgi:hypothetical protein
MTVMALPSSEYIFEFPAHERPVAAEAVIGARGSLTATLPLRGMKLVVASFKNALA